MKQILRLFRSRAAVFAHDLLMVPIAWFGAYWLRFNLQSIPQPFVHWALLLFPLVLVVQAGLFWYFGLYRGLWRFASVPDLVRIVKAVAVGAAVSALAVALFTRLHEVPRSVFFLDAVLLVLLLGGPRFIYRWSKDRHLYSLGGKKTLIMGAGRAGEMLVRDLMRDPGRTYQPVAFVDDDAAKHGKEIHGIPVMGPCDDIATIIPELEVELVLIAVPAATTQAMRRLVGLCEAQGVPFRVLPRLQDLVSGQIGLKDLRDVRIEDLLGREPVELDWEAISNGHRGKTILVTGGGGSIGSELCRQVARLRPGALIVFERSEFNLYSIEQELRRSHPGLRLACVLGDIGDAVAVEHVFRTHAPDIVFHAAAYKHVPMLEQQARAAVLNNALGTRTVARLADQCGCGSFVLISTDKAVNPSNVMGASKRIAELYCQNLGARSRTHFVTVRFGNVLGSSGSVIPLFQQQIAHGGPVTVTHPDITRYFMTVPEAGQLILQASIMGRGGEIFVLDMGEPVKISYLAEQLILLSGKKPERDVEIVYTGLRPGEKLHEELFHAAEQQARTSHPKILLAQSRRTDQDRLERAVDELEEACARNDRDRLDALLAALVPEFRSAVTGAAERPPGAVVYPWDRSRTPRTGA